MPFNLEDALEAINNKPEFKVRIADGVTIIDYQISAKDTFKGNTPRETFILQNLRGTAFNSDGRIVSLPFHKFHNLNETSGYMHNEINWEHSHEVFLKMDGSMIRPIPIVRHGLYRLATRAGVTDVSMEAEKFVASLPIDVQRQYHQFINTMLDWNRTPIFEFVSRKNKIVIDYPDAALVLLAVRDNWNGDYCRDDQFHAIRMNFPDIPIVEKVTEFSVDNVRKWTHAEGVVISFSNGFKVKVKADEYVLKHRAKDLLQFEKDVLKIVLENKLDDLLAVVPEESDKERLEAYAENVFKAIEYVVDTTDSMVNTLQSAFSTRKEQAIWINTMLRAPFAGFVFSALDGKDTRSVIMQYAIRQCGSSTSVDQLKKDFVAMPNWEV